MSSCWTSDRHVRINAVVSILWLWVTFGPSAKLPSSFCCPCIQVKTDLSKSGSEYLCRVMEDRAWTVSAVSLEEIAEIVSSFLFFRQINNRNTWDQTARRHRERIRRLTWSSKCSVEFRSSWCPPCQRVFWRTDCDGSVPARWQGSTDRLSQWRSTYRLDLTLFHLVNW